MILITKIYLTWIMFLFSVLNFNYEYTIFYHVYFSFVKAFVRRREVNLKTLFSKFPILQKKKKKIK